ncbi:hypothetical protein ATI61_106249 [Archangium gephyra]|uniref:Uncharacterized protein n=1 Tax=Archangium gephyra TaxID=48 RepID=A0AAC8TAI6_9BACT|nr:hypothetical protein [Archangium gephyra]AKI98861.1 Hypothetical protein AA314_00488 [Archangium gephyra]REG30779.1 hypothetical protein ATI61_106249 [Archangium gephyra]
MARISQDQAQERHAFLLDLFRNQPDISRNEAMDAYKDKFGASLNAKTFNELREQALRDAENEEKAEESVSEAEETPVEETKQRVVAAALDLTNGAGTPAAAAAAAAKKPKAKGAGAKNVFVDATQEQLQFLEKVLIQLQDSGANNVRIDHATDRWMVLTVDSK